MEGKKWSRTQEWTEAEKNKLEKMLMNINLHATRKPVFHTARTPNVSSTSMWEILDNIGEKGKTMKQSPVNKIHKESWFRFYLTGEWWVFSRGPMAEPLVRFFTTGLVKLLQGGGSVTIWAGIVENTLIRLIQFNDANVKLDVGK